MDEVHGTGLAVTHARPFDIAFRQRPDDVRTDMQALLSIPSVNSSSGGVGAVSVLVAQFTVHNGILPLRCSTALWRRKAVMGCHISPIRHSVEPITLLSNIPIF